MLLTALATTLARRLASALALLALAVLVTHGAALVAGAHGQGGQPSTLAAHTQVHAAASHDRAGGSASGMHQGVVPHSCCDVCAFTLPTPLAVEATLPPVALLEALAHLAPPTGLDPGGLRRPPRRAVIA